MIARVARAVVELGEKRRVDLQRVEGELADRGERRVAGAEAIQRDPHPDAAQVVELGHRDLALAGEHRLGDLEHEPVRLQAAAAQRARDRAREPWRREVARGHVDVHGRRGELGVVGEDAAPVRELAAGEHEDLRAERHGEPRRLGGGEELRGGEQAVVGVLPAHERLDGGDRAGRQVEDRLVVQAQLAVGERAAQALLDLRGVQQAPAHALRRELRPRAAALARAGRRDRRGPQDLGHGRRAALGQHDADARRHRQLAPAGEHRLGERGADALGHVERVAVGRDAGQQHGEVVAGEAPGGRVRGEHALQARTDADEHLVAGAVAEAVVELAEAVEVDEQHRGLLLLAARAIEGALEAVLEQRAVREAGERVLQPEPGDLRVRAPARERRADDVRDRLREALVAGLAARRGRRRRRRAGRSWSAVALQRDEDGRSPCRRSSAAPRWNGSARRRTAAAIHRRRSCAGAWPRAPRRPARRARRAGRARSPPRAAARRRSRPSGRRRDPRRGPRRASRGPTPQRSAGSRPASALWPSATTSAWRAIRSARSCSTSLWSVMSRMKPVYVACEPLMRVIAISTGKIEPSARIASSSMRWSRMRSVPPSSSRRRPRRCASRKSGGMISSAMSSPSARPRE